MQWAAAAAVCDCNDLYDQVIIHRPTTYYHDFAPSSASAPFFAGPSAWNRLPEDICAESDIANFRKLLKTHYFSSAFMFDNCIF